MKYTSRTEDTTLWNLAITDTRWNRKVSGYASYRWHCTLKIEKMGCCITVSQCKAKYRIASNNNRDDY